MSAQYLSSTGGNDSSDGVRGDGATWPEGSLAMGPGGVNPQCHNVFRT
jgi:hypothetical protein